MKFIEIAGSCLLRLQQQKKTSCKRFLLLLTSITNWSNVMYSNATDMFNAVCNVSASQNMIKMYFPNVFKPFTYCQLESPSIHNANFSPAFYNYSQLRFFCKIDSVSHCLYLFNCFCFYFSPKKHHIIWIAAINSFVEYQLKCCPICHNCKCKLVLWFCFEKSVFNKQ